MSNVPTNLIPTRITGLPEYMGTSTLGYIPYILDGRTYKVQFGQIAAVGAVPSTRVIAAGTGLAGGGDLSENRVISIANGGVGFDQLSATGVVAGSYGSGSAVPVITVDLKGRVTDISTTPLVITGYVPDSRLISTGAGLLGGGSLASNRTLSVDFSSATPQALGSATAGVSNAAARGDHVHPAVNLSDTTQTQGALPLGRGGTGDALSPVAGAVVYSTGTKLALADPGNPGQVLTSAGAGEPYWATIPGTGTVTNVSVLTANGFGGTVAFPDTTPQITLNTTVTGIIKGDGTSMTAASPGVDYALPGANNDITSMTGLTGGISTPDYIDFDTGATVARATGRLWWDNADGIQTLNLGMAGSNATLQIGEEMYFRIKASSAITEGQVVMFTGTVGNSGALTGAPATGLTKDTASYIMGVATESIALNGWGYVTQFGLVRSINTTGGAEAWVDGQILYYDPTVAGGLTKTVPTAPAAKVEVAAVVKAASNGSLFVRPIARFSLGQLNDVETAAATNNDLLQYNGASGYWQHVVPSTISVGTATNLAGGAANRIAYQTGAGATSFITAPTVANTFLEWSGSAFQWSSNPLGTVTSVAASGGSTGLTFSGSPITTSGTLTLGGTLALASGGTGSTTAAGARTNLGLGTAAVLNAGVANGVATLDSAGTVPTSQLPAAVLGALNYQGTWNASTNTPTLTSSVGTKGYYYVVDVAGSTNLNGITDWKVGDWAVYSGTAWQKIDNTDGVTSVNGYTGAVSLTYSDVGAPSATGTGASGTWNISVTGNAANVSGVVAVANGGTGATSLTSGYLLKGNGTSAVSASVVYDNGTNVGIGTNIPGYRLTVIGGDTTNAFIAGATRGVRFAFNSTTSRIEGVDGTGAASYQPLDINGSIVTTSIGGTEKMRLDASGNLGIGTSSPAARVHIVNSALAGQLRLQDVTTDATNKYAVIGAGHYTNSEEPVSAITVGSLSASSTVYIGGGTGALNAATAIQFYTAANNTTLTGTEAMRIDNAGQVGIGGAASTGTTLRIGKNLTGSVNVIGVYNNQAIQSDVTSNASLFATFPTTAASAFTLSSLYHFNAAQSTIGATSAITTQIGFLAQSSLTGATNNYGFYGALASGTGRYNLYMAGTADNYLAGNLGIGTASPSFRLDVVNNVAGLARFSMTNPNAGMTQTDLRIGAGSNSNDVFFGINSTGTFIDDRSGGQNIVFSRSGSERMRIDSVGNVGIGTNSPGAKLDVSGGDFRLASNATYVRSVTSGGTSVRMLGINSGDTAYVGPIDSGPTSTIFNASSTSALATFNTNGTERMRISSAGYVGVGTSSPSFPLDVQSTGVGSTIAARIFRSDGTVALLRVGNSSSGSASSAPAFGSDTTAAVVYTNNTERMRIDNSGNVGIGVTPSAWGGGSKALQFSTGALEARGAGFSLNANAYFNGANWIYVSTANAGLYNLNSGQHQWYTAPSGTAGTAITFTQAMTLDANGNLGIGTTSPGGSATDRQVTIQGTTAQLSLGNGSFVTNVGTSASLGYLQVSGANPLALYTNGSERMRIDSSGRVGIGVTPSAWTVTALQMASSSAIGFNNQYGEIDTNAYYNAGYKYIGTGLAAKYGQEAGVHKWFTAPSGTAGAAITFTQAMTLDASGNLGIGTASPSARLDVVTASGTQILSRFAEGSTAAPELSVRSTATGVSLRSGFNTGIAGSFDLLATGGSSYMTFGTASTERMRITYDGNVGIGTSSPPYKLSVYEGDIRLYTSSSEAIMRIRQASAAFDTQLRQDSSGNFIIALGSTEHFRIGSSGQIGLSGANYGTSGQVLTSNGSGSAPTWQSVAGGTVSYPQNVQSGNYTLVLSDAGKHIYSANTGAQVITVPTNASVAFPIGTLITIVNMGTSSIRLSNAGVSIYPNGSRTAISVPVVSSGVSMQLVKTDTNSWNATFGSVIEGSSISYLVVAGGGGGGSSNTGAAGGGAGGMRTGTVSYAAGTYTVTVGAGGTGGATSTNANGANGSDSVFSTITSLGGGGGAGPANTFGLSGGSGSGGTWQSYAGGAGTAGQGNNGGRGSDGFNYGGGGGGGAGAAGGLSTGGNGGVGGAGLASSITGTSVFYAGGGGGCAVNPGAGGVGGGGAGSPYNSATGNGTAGTANTGGGGGGGGGNVWGAGGNGGSGVVIIASAVAANSTTGSPTVTLANGITIYTFTSSGTITW